MVVVSRVLKLHFKIAMLISMHRWRTKYRQEGQGQRPEEAGIVQDWRLPRLEGNNVEPCVSICLEAKPQSILLRHFHRVSSLLTCSFITVIAVQGEYMGKACHKCPFVGVSTNFMIIVRSPMYITRTLRSL